MEQNSDFKALRVAVTGGTSGLGLALVRLLSKEGARVAFVARSAGAVELTANETGAVGIVGDIGRKEDIISPSATDQGPSRGARYSCQ